MKKLLKRIASSGRNENRDTLLLESLLNLQKENIFWYPSAYKDIKFIKKFNEEYMVKNDMPRIDLFLHSDYRYYKNLFEDMSLPYKDSEGHFTIERIEEYFLLNDDERQKYYHKFVHDYRYEYQYAIKDEPDFRLAEVRAEGMEKPVLVAYTQIENNILLNDVIKPYKLPVKYVCTHIDGDAEGGNYTSFHNEPYKTNFENFVKKNKVCWIEGERA